MERARSTVRWLVIACAAAGIVAGLVPPFAALLLGAICAAVCGEQRAADAAAHRLMPISIVALGCGIDLPTVVRTGADGLLATALMLAMTFACGWLLARRLRIGGDVALMVAAGTAICGGSAIAAVAPLIRARSQQVAVAIGVVFALNGAALLVFPLVGSASGLGADAFGTWCALAIHDTSSVVAAAATHSDAALETATVTKLARMLWIVPVGVAVVAWRRRAQPREAAARPKVPWFLLVFVLVSALRWLVPELRSVGSAIAGWAPVGMTLALLCIGLGLGRSSFQILSLRTWSFGVLLWLLLAAVSFAFVASW